MDGFDTKAVVKAGLRSALTSVPALAPWIQLWNEHESEELKRRVDRFWQAFVLEAKHSASRFEKIERTIEYVRDSVAIVERAVDHARRDPSEPKQSAYAKVAAAAIVIGPAMRYDEKVSCIDLVDALTETDISVLRLFAGGKTRKVGEISGYETTEAIGHLVASLSKLTARGLIGETSSKRGITVDSWAGDADYWPNQWRRRYFELLPFGRMFLDLLS